MGLYLLTASNRADSRRRGSGIVPIPRSGSFPRCGGRAFQRPAHSPCPRAAGDVGVADRPRGADTGYHTPVDSDISRICQWEDREIPPRLDRLAELTSACYTSEAERRGEFRGLSTPLQLSPASHGLRQPVTLPDWSPSQLRGGSMALRRQWQAWNVKYALAVVPCEDTYCSPWGPEVVLPGASHDTKRTGPPQGGGPVVKVSGRLVGRC